MGLSKAAALLLALFMVGCATASKLYRDHEFKDTVWKYEKALRWSDFRVANAFRKPASSRDDPPDYDNLARFKVTSYAVQETVPLMDQSQVRQSVEIGYYIQGAYIEKRITDHQIWEYDREERKWYILTPLPAFK